MSYMLTHIRLYMHTIVRTYTPWYHCTYVRTSVRPTEFMHVCGTNILLGPDSLPAWFAVGGVIFFF